MKINKLLISNDATLVHVCDLLLKNKNVNELYFYHNSQTPINYDLLFACAFRFDKTIIKVEIDLYKLNDFVKTCTQRDKRIFKEIDLVIVIDDESFLQLKKLNLDAIEFKLQYNGKKDKISIKVAGCYRE